MAVYKCIICGYVFDEEKEGRKFSDITACPACGVDVSMLELQESDTPAKPETQPTPNESRYMAEIHRMAETGRTISGAMGTQMEYAFMG